MKAFRLLLLLVVVSALWFWAGRTAGYSRGYADGRIDGDNIGYLAGRDSVECPK